MHQRTVCAQVGQCDGKHDGRVEGVRVLSPEDTGLRRQRHPVQRRRFVVGPGVTQQCSEVHLGAQCGRVVGAEDLLVT